jgi:hypothetical protein
MRLFEKIANGEQSQRASPHLCGGAAIELYRITHPALQRATEDSKETAVSLVEVQRRNAGALLVTFVARQK